MFAWNTKSLLIYYCVYTWLHSEKKDTDINEQASLIRSADNEIIALGAAYNDETNSLEAMGYSTLTQKQPTVDVPYFVCMWMNRHDRFRHENWKHADYYFAMFQ